MDVSSPHCCLPHVLLMTDWGPMGADAVPFHLLTVRRVLADVRKANSPLQCGFLSFIAHFQPSSHQAEPSHWEINPLLLGLAVWHVRPCCLPGQQCAALPHRLICSWSSHQPHWPA